MWRRVGNSPHLARANTRRGERVPGSTDETAMGLGCGDSGFERSSITRALTALGACAALVATSAAGAAPATVPGRNGRIAFSRVASVDRDNGMSHANLWMTAPGGRVRVIFKHRRLSATAASWAPDGRTIAFEAYCGSKYFLNCSSIWRVGVDGRGLRRLSGGGAQDYCPSWSPDGTRLAFTAVFEGAQNVLSGIYAMDADGSNRTRVTSGELDGCPDWSPHGNSIAFWRPDELDVVSMADGSIRKVLTGVGRYDAAPRWAPDASTLAFTATERGGNTVETVHSDGTGLRRIAHGESVAWSPNGTRMVFERLGEIYTIRSTGGRATRVTRRRMRTASSPAWQPLGAER
jgi:TolB protein